MMILKTTLTKNKHELLLLGSSCYYNHPLVVGVVHGDEPQGFTIIKQYTDAVENSNLLFIPELNPDGRINNTRVNANGVDINRNFPTQNWEKCKKDNYFGGEFPGSETETKFLTDIVNEYKPNIILTLHTPYKIVNYDGPAEKYANEISEIINYPTEKSIGYPTPGSFGTWAGIERNIPVITLEMDENEDINILYKKVKNIFKYLENI